MVASPTACAVAVPDAIVAIASLSLSHETEPVTYAVVPVLYVACTASEELAPGAIDTAWGMTLSETITLCTLNRARVTRLGAQPGLERPRTQVGRRADHLEGAAQTRGLGRVRAVRRAAHEGAIGRGQPDRHRLRERPARRCDDGSGHRRV